MGPRHGSSTCSFRWSSGSAAPLVAIVGTSIGAGLRERALAATWLGAAIAFSMTEVIGVAAALWPNAWLSLFASDHAMREAGAQYLHAVGPLYGFFGVGLVLYFASHRGGPARLARVR